MGLIGVLGFGFFASGLLFGLLGDLLSLQWRVNVGLDEPKHDKRMELHVHGDRSGESSY